MGQPPAIVNGRHELQGIELPQEALENIMWRNFERFATPTPKPVAVPA
jgi:hypothetical protein